MLWYIATFGGDENHFSKKHLVFKFVFLREKISQKLIGFLFKIIHDKVIAIIIEMKKIKLWHNKITQNKALWI